MRCSLELKLSIPLDEELLFPKEEPQINLQDIVEQPQVEEQTDDREEEPTQPESSREGRKRNKVVYSLVQDEWEHVGAPISLCRKRRSLDIYTGYMALMT